MFLVTGETQYKRHGKIVIEGSQGQFGRTSFTVFGFGKFDVESRWELSSYAALDSMRDHDDETWNKLISENSEFFEPSIPGETYLMRSEEDVRIIE